MNRTAIESTRATIGCWTSTARAFSNSSLQINPGPRVLTGSLPFGGSFLGSSVGLGLVWELRFYICDWHGQTWGCARDWSACNRY